MNKLYIIMPAYNEMGAIDEVVSSWHEIVKQIGNDSKLIVIDDGSKDNTYAKLKELEKKYPSLLALTKLNSGHGPTLIYGYKYAINNNADYVFQTDSDGQTNPNEFMSFWELRNEYDAILGKRVKRGDGLARSFVEKVVCFLLRIYFGVTVPDANAPFRLMKVDLLKKYIDRLSDRYNLPNIMLTTFFSFYNEKICFKEISFKPRHSGKNTINFKKIINIGIQSLKDFRSFKSEMNS